MTDIDLNFIATQQTSVRNEMRAQTALLRLLDARIARVESAIDVRIVHVEGIMTAILDELRAFRPMLSHMDDRVRTLEEDEARS